MRTYTFHVALPDYADVWRKIELPADATLEGLHFAIQDAYAFDNGHLYSFFMSGQPWDDSTEFTLPEDADPWGGTLFTEVDEENPDAADEDDGYAEDEYGDDEYDDEADEATTATLPPDLLGGLETPTPAQLRTLFQLLQNDPQARQQFAEVMSQQIGMPPAMIDMLINNMDTAFQGMSDDQMSSLLQMTDPLAMGDEAADAAGDVRTTALDTLQLRAGQSFLYLFDYGDEWQFSVSVAAINPNADPNAQYPRVVESVGEAPEQYPDWEDEAEA